MQIRFNHTVERLEHIPGWTLSTWSDRSRKWHFEASGPGVKWECGGYHNEQDAKRVGRRSIDIAG